jgi:hypothetical protein
MIDPRKSADHWFLNPGHKLPDRPRSIEIFYAGFSGNCESIYSEP